MSCCGKKREVSQPRPRILVTPNRAPADPAPPRTLVTFRGTGSYLIAGPHSRRVYSFSSKEPDQWVDPKDALAMIRTGLFQIAV